MMYNRKADTGARARKVRKPLYVKVPLWWLEEVAKATRSPQAFVAVWLLKLHFENHGLLTFPLPNGRLAKRGCDRKAKWRALANLEKAGLITIERRPRKSPIVSLVVI
jgi:hypothetical protein